MNVITNNKGKAELAFKTLRHVLDPEIGLNIVDLGLIYQLDFDESGKEIFCKMTLTTQFCPMGESLTAGVANALQSVFPEYHIELGLTFDPAWSQENISEEGLKFLNA